MKMELLSTLDIGNLVVGACHKTSRVRAASENAGALICFDHVQRMRWINIFTNDCIVLAIF